ncbi:UNVERIFIED_CONTAM: hypothetical protein FKN15_055554 [Acipenser sinensis]
MASSPCGSNSFDSGLEIKTRSVEQTLIPLVSQVFISRRLHHNAEEPGWSAFVVVELLTSSQIAEVTVL